MGRRDTVLPNPLKHTEMADRKLITLKRYDRAEEAAIAQSLLENAGIHYAMRNEYMSQIFPFGQDFAVELLVAEDDLQQAEAVLKAYSESPVSGSSR